MKNRFVLFLAWSFAFSVSMINQAASQTRTNAIPARPKGPGDIYAAAGYPPVAAHSTTRALYASYNGPLYQVMRQSDGKTLDIGVVKPSAGDPGGYANAAAQDVFLINTIGWITKIYDQSGKGNDLVQAPPGTFKGPAKGEFNTLPIADMAPATINGHKVYGVYIMPGMGLRNNHARGIAINDEPEGMYYVINGKHFDSGCCFDYGNSSTNGRAVGTGTMETTYFGTATAWGSGNGPGPWIMADMEAGLFSGYNAKKNDVPTIDSWRFVSAFVDGGGGNKWDLRGGNAQEGGLTTFYSGVRPGTPGSNAYFPMNKKGGILLGNGGDNGNGSAGTFYEGIMTTGFPAETTTDNVHANIVGAKYDVPMMNMSRLNTFTPGSAQETTLTFTNTTGAPVAGLKLGLAPRKGWTVSTQGANSSTKTFLEPIAPNATVSATFKITSSTTDAGFLTGRAEWKSTAGAQSKVETTTQRIRSVLLVKINEVRFATGDNTTNQFVELYNAADTEVDISNWNLMSTPSGWASVSLGKVPAGTKIKPKGFYLLGLAASGLLAPVTPAQKTINVRSIAGMEVGQEINVDGELRTITNVRSAASPMSTLFIPVSIVPWFNFPKGTTNLPVTNAAGFAVGEKIGIDFGGNYEVATVTNVGKAATQTNLFAGAKAGDRTIKVLDNANITVNDELTINTGARKEVVKVKRIINVVTAPARGAAGQGGEIELTTPLKLDHQTGVDVWDKGTGISFTPATKFTHKSGDAVQALGSGITLEKGLTRSHATGAPVFNAKNTTAGYQGTTVPNHWYGVPLSTTAGSIALMDARNTALVDGMVYGSRQSNSSANGTIASPEIATLEGDQAGGGCIVVVPTPPRGFQQAPSTTDQTNKSFGRFPDGSDNDNNCSDFLSQNSITLALAANAGATNIKVPSVADFNAGQQIIVGSGNSIEVVVITSVGTAGGTKVGTAVSAGSTIIPVFSVAGFNAGQTITIGSGENLETVAISSVTAGRRRFGGAASGPTDSITVSSPLKFEHKVDEQVAGSGITVSSPFKKGFDTGTQVSSYIPTPGAPNRYARKP